MSEGEKEISSERVKNKSREGVVLLIVYLLLQYGL